MKRKTSLCLAILLMLSFLMSGCKGQKEVQPEETNAQPVNVQGEAKGEK